MKFLFMSEFGETADLASYLRYVEGHDVWIHISQKNYKQIAAGIIPPVEEWWRFIGQNYIWVFDSCSFGDLQDWLRENGEWVVGGSRAGDELENDRQLNQKWFRALGFDQVESHNFTNVDDAITFVEEHSDRVWILKQNGDAPKHLSHKGQFDDSEDMLFHLRELKKGWNEQEFGKFDVDLMEVVEGVEVAASAFWNGKDWLRNQAGRVVGFLNFEEKKEANDGSGETCGEMGTTFVGVTDENILFREIILRPGVGEKLADLGFRGVFDINCIEAEDGRLVALEPTCRFGVPATSYELMEGLESTASGVLEALAKGFNRAIEIRQGIGMVMCVVAKPFPLEVDVEPDGTSVGEKLWILQDGKPVTDLTEEQRQHIHLYNFERVADDDTGEISYKVPTKNGYLLTVTGKGKTIPETRDALIEYIRDNLYFPGMKYRTDIGMRVEKYV